MVNSLAISVPDSVRVLPAKWSKPIFTGTPVPSTSKLNILLNWLFCKVLKLIPSKVLKRGAKPPETVAGSDERLSVNWLSENFWVLELTNKSLTWLSGFNWPYLLTYIFSPVAESVACCKAAATSVSPTYT